MPIQVTCASCRGVFNAPDTAAGKRAKCPTCGGAIEIPAQATEEEVLDAEPELESPYTDDDFAVEPPPSLPETADTKKCPMCGETIQHKALKCRFCGEVFDPLLKNAERSRRPESANESKDRWNSILIFATGIIGCFSPIMAIVGMVFLSRRPYSYPLKWMAVAGTVLHCIWAVLLVLRLVAIGMNG